MSDSRPGVEAPLVDRPNGEPPIVRGLTATELAWAAGLAFFCWLPAGLVLARVAGTPVVAVLFCSIVPTMRQIQGSSSTISTRLGDMVTRSPSVRLRKRPASVQVFAAEPATRP